MTKSQPTYTWQQADDNLDDNEAMDSTRQRWLTEQEQQKDSDPRSTAPRYQYRRDFVYELMIALVLVGSFAGYLLWQRVESRLSQLEDELQTLQRDLSASDTAEAGTSIRFTPGAIETRYFRFEFGKQDRSVVTAVAAYSDARYAQLRQEFGLAAPTTKLTIEVDDEPYRHPSVRYPGIHDVRLQVAPLAADASGYSSPKAAFANALFSQLSRRVLSEAMAERRVKPQWGALIDGLYFYFWLEQDSTSTLRASQFYQENRRRARTFPLALALQTEVFELDEATFDPTKETRHRTYLMANPLMEYIMVTYGHSYLLPLLDGFSQHETWETLIPAVFDISASEFEVQWHAYLRES
ncbi:hypothetical protein KFU94_63320 [Chloroflexi bacterium TSY]|nr:hypothetical protein [Chloroflexi bacterium TSY]